MIFYRVASRTNCQFYDAGEVNSQGIQVNANDPTLLPINIECASPANLWEGYLHEETVIHELGHLFDSRSDTYIRDKIDDGLPLRSCSAPPRVIMGNGFAQDARWGRGDDGWGSVSSNEQDVSQFQQNPANTPEEATADMFLNWIYRYTTGGVVDPGTGIILNESNACDTMGPFAGVGDWQGFNNIDNDGVFDSSLPGNIRFIWTENQMNVIFDLHPDWR